MSVFAGDENRLLEKWEIALGEYTGLCQVNLVTDTDSGWTITGRPGTGRITDQSGIPVSVSALHFS